MLVSCGVQNEETILATCRKVYQFRLRELCHLAIRFLHAERLTLLPENLYRCHVTNWLLAEKLVSRVHMLN